MKYILLIDLILFLIIVKVIFKRFTIFFKALYIYFLSSSEIPLIRLEYEKWEKEQDSNHKIHLLYWFVFALIGLSILAYYLFIDRNFLVNRR